MNPRSIVGYMRHGGVSPLQSALKHNIVPIDEIVAHLPQGGVILDLGCGEGILANLVAGARPDCLVRGFDRDAARVAIAQRHARPNARFEVADIFDLPETGPVDALIFNDVVHHQQFAQQPVLLERALERLRHGGAIVLKEVDRGDRLDRFMTEIFDRKLYPDDPLCFRVVSDWIAVLHRVGADQVSVTRIRRRWPASRTMFFAVKAGTPSAPPAPPLSSAADVLVTGVTGFIGGHLARALLRDGLNGSPVRVLGLVRDPKRVPADLAAAGMVPIFGDLSDLPRLRDRLTRVRIVFHLAAEVKLTGGLDLWRNNYDGTVSLLEALKDLPLERFIHASTMGAVDRGPDDRCEAPLDESVPPHPLSEYGRTKLKAEEAVIGSGLPYTIVRITWAYGPGMTPDTHVRFLMQGVADGKLFARFHFPGRVSVVAVDDLVDAMLLVARRPEARGQVYYVSDGEPIALGELFRVCASVIGRPLTQVPIPGFVSTIARRWRARLPLALQNLNSDVLCASNARIRALGFQSQVSKREGLTRLARDLGVLPNG